MRPSGQIRQAVLHAVQCAAPMGATWHDLARELVPQGIARHAVRNTVKNMARDGALRPAGWVRVPGVSRALAAWVPGQDSAHGSLVLDCVLRGGWMR